MTTKMHAIENAFVWTGPYRRVQKVINSLVVFLEHLFNTTTTTTTTTNNRKINNSFEKR